MSIAEIALAGAAILSAGGAIAATVWRRPVDKATEEQIRTEVSVMTADSNKWRDAYLWRLQTYVNRDAKWHYAVNQLLNQAQSAGFIPPEATIPEAPPIPEPPPYEAG